MEVAFQTALLAHFRLHGYFAKKIQFKGIAGCPDLLIAKNGKESTWIEVKWNRCEVTPLQKKTITIMQATGFHVICLAIYGNKWTECSFVIFDHIDGTIIKKGMLHELIGLIYD